MTDRPDLESLARSIIDTNLYMVLGTADEGGQPWVAPVYYAPPPVVYRPAPVYAPVYPAPLPPSGVSIRLHFPL